MTGVILVIDELIDQGIIMQLDSNIILQRIGSKNDGKNDDAQPASGGLLGSLMGVQQAQENSGMFSSIFSSARSQVSKTLAL